MQGSTCVLDSGGHGVGSLSTRRSFFGAAGGAALLCTIGGEQVSVDRPRALRKADLAAARVGRPRGAAAAQAVPQIQPAPGGVRKEYWIQAETARLAITPGRRDEWHNRAVEGGRNEFTAFVYREMTTGFAEYKYGRLRSPGRC